MNINATFFAELLAFCIFVFITYRYIWPSMENLLEDRRKEISDGLEAASQSQRKLEEANKESATILDGAKAEASSLINQANSRACLLYTSPSPRDISGSRMPSSA